MTKKDKMEYDNKYIKENYDTIKLLVPKGEKEKIKQKAEKKGFKSMSEYIKTLIRDDAGGAFRKIRKSLP